MWHQLASNEGEMVPNLTPYVVRSYEDSEIQSKMKARRDKVKKDH